MRHFQASVVCRQLGYRGALDYTKRQPSPISDSQPIIANVTCTNTTSLHFSECTFKNISEVGSAIKVSCQGRCGPGGSKNCIVCGNKFRKFDCTVYSGPHLNWPTMQKWH